MVSRLPCSSNSQWQFTAMGEPGINTLIRMLAAPRISDPIPAMQGAGRGGHGAN
jgi:hypothetical protein